MAPSSRETSISLQEELTKTVDDVSKAITRLLPETDLPEAPLFEAMRYGTLNGGKRLRPFLVIHCAKLFNVDPKRARRAAAAVEFVHCYSLIHDDLPAMGNANTRRGKPSTHKAFDEATAILAGDALLTKAFEILADPETHEDPRVRIELVASLAEAAGGHGLCGGEMLYLVGEKASFDLGTISRLTAAGLDGFRPGRAALRLPRLPARSRTGSATAHRRTRRGIVAPRPDTNIHRGALSERCAAGGLAGGLPAGDATLRWPPI